MLIPRLFKIEDIEATATAQNWYYQWTLFVIYNISYSVALYAVDSITPDFNPFLDAKFGVCLVSLCTVCSLARLYI